MAPIVAPNVARFSLTGTYDDQPVATVLDIEPAIVSGDAPDRSSFLSQTAERLGEAFLDIVFPMSNALSYDTVNYVDMDSADGLVGSYTISPPIVGTGAYVDSLPGNVAVRYNKISGGFQRGQRQGRMYIAGGLETWLTTSGPNVLGSITITLQGAADAFMTSLEEELVDPVGGGTYTPNLVVVHTTRATPESDPVFSGKTTVTGLVVQARLASQRRRLTL